MEVNRVNPTKSIGIRELVVLRCEWLVIGEFGQQTGRGGSGAATACRRPSSKKSHTRRKPSCWGARSVPEGAGCRRAQAFRAANARLKGGWSFRAPLTLSLPENRRSPGWGSWLCFVASLHAGGRRRTRRCGGTSWLARFWGSRRSARGCPAPRSRRRRRTARDRQRRGRTASRG